MPVICIGPVCIPWTCLPPIVFFFWKFIKPCLPQAVAEAIERYAFQAKEFCMPYLQKVPGFRKKAGKENGNGCCSSSSFVAGEVCELQSKKQLEMLKERSKVEGFHLILDFSAGFCKPCQALKPRYKELAQAFPQHCFLEVDAETLDDVVGDYEVMGLPTFKVLAGGEVVDGGTGLSEKAMVQLVEKHLAGQNGNGHKKAQ
mmetsp:Transcript_57450/g.136594  ORF Transcript_57450/g.136594 Transcript_57450/m.136594 type:complete len:201 (+) Transcript_57450:50-652(+)